METPSQPQSNKDERAQKMEDDLRHAEHLVVDPHFKALFEPFLQFVAEREMSAALDVTKSREDRDNSAHKFAVAREIREFLPARLKTLRKALEGK